MINPATSSTLSLTNTSATLTLSITPSYYFKGAGNLGSLANPPILNNFIKIIHL
jgi:hypothetical protein